MHITTTGGARNQVNASVPVPGHLPLPLLVHQTLKSNIPAHLLVLVLLMQFKLQLLPNIRMGLSWLPALAFDPATATKGAAGAEAVINPTTDPGMVNATFDLATLVIPDLSRENTFIYGRNIRLPPFLRVALHATKMEVSSFNGIHGKCFFWVDTLEAMCCSKRKRQGIIQQSLCPLVDCANQDLTTALQ